MRELAPTVVEDDQPSTPDVEEVACHWEHHGILESDAGTNVALIVGVPSGTIRRDANAAAWKPPLRIYSWHSQVTYFRLGTQAYTPEKLTCLVKPASAGITAHRSRGIVGLVSSIALVDLTGIASKLRLVRVWRLPHAR